LDEPLEAEGGMMVTEAVDTITWTATGDMQINRGEFDWIWVSAGPLPSDVDSLSFPTVVRRCRASSEPARRGHRRGDPDGSVIDIVSHRDE
jgi:hypothetical protein